MGGLHLVGQKGLTLGREDWNVEVSTGQDSLRLSKGESEGRVQR